MTMQRFDFSDFSRIRIERALSVDILQSNAYSLTINEDPTRVRVEKEGDTLVIGRRGLDFMAMFHPRPHVVVTMPALETVEITGACQVKAVGFQSPALSIKLAGASHLEMTRSSAGNLKINAEGASNFSGSMNLSGELRLDVYGASRAELTGSGNNAHIVLAGASQGRLGNFTLRQADVRATGASSIQLNAAETLDVNLSGASRLEYSGHPVLHNIQISGASVVKQR